MITGRTPCDGPAEDSIRDIMEQLSMSEPEARAYRDAFMQKYLSDREKIYQFLKKHNPRVQQLEESGDYSRRIEQVFNSNAFGSNQMSKMTATAVVITTEILSEGATKILRKKKAKASAEDIQQMLGVTVPIPDDILNAVGAEHLTQ